MLVTFSGYITMCNVFYEFQLIIKNTDNLFQWQMFLCYVDKSATGFIHKRFENMSTIFHIPE